MSSIKMNTKIEMKEFNELLADNIVDFLVAKNRLNYLADNITTFGTMFKNMHRLSWPAVSFALENNIMSTTEYVKKIKNFSFPLCEMLGSKWGAVLYKNNNILAKKILVTLIIDFVKCGAASGHCMIGLKIIESIGAFGRRCRLTKRDINPCRIAVRGGVAVDDVSIVLKMMAL
jgi:hypothetical protein